MAPTLTISGASTTNEGASYVLDLASSDPGADTISGWLIQWGDGTSTTVTGNPSAVNHVYADGFNQFTITATGSDEDGQHEANSITVIVHDIAPTLAISGAASVDEGTPYTLNLSAIVVGADPISKWTITWRDGEVETILGNPSAVSHVYGDGSNNYSISATATDDDGTFLAGTTAAVTVGNVAPSATFSVDEPITFGETATVRFSNPFDPSAADTNAGFRYAFASSPVGFNGVTYAVGSSASDSFAVADLPPGDHIIYGRIIDNDEGYREYSTVIQVSTAGSLAESLSAAVARSN